MATDYDEDRKRKPRRLKKLDLNRVDLVASGANPGAHVMFFKSDETVDVEKRIVEEDGQFCVRGKDTNRNFGCFDTRDEAVERLRQVEGFSKSDMVEGIMSAEETVEAPEDAPVEKDDDVSEPGVETVAKADFEALQKELETYKAEADKSKTLEERIAKMERERKEGEFISKARELDNLAPAEQLGKMLLEVEEGTSEDTFKGLTQILKAANARMEKSDLFSQFAQGGEAESPSATERIATLAKEKVERGEAKTLEVAKMQVVREHPELTNEYVSSR